MSTEILDTHRIVASSNYELAGDAYVLDNAIWEKKIQLFWEHQLENATAVIESSQANLSIPAAELPVQETEEQKLQHIKEKIENEARESAKAIELNAQNQAQQLMDQAHHEAEQWVENLKTQTRNEIELLKNVAHDEGYQEGKTQGQTEGYTAGKSEAALEYKELLSNWKKILNETIKERKKNLEELKPILAELVGEALYQCLKFEGASRNEVVIHFVEEALSKAENQALLRVHLNPADIEVLNEKKKELQMKIGGKAIELISDTRIERGGCLLETEAGSIDARLKTIVDQVKDSIVEE